MKLLILLVVVLGLVAAVQLSKVYQLSISLRGRREEERNRRKDESLAQEERSSQE